MHQRRRRVRGRAVPAAAGAGATVGVLVVAAAAVEAQAGWKRTICRSSTSVGAGTTSFTRWSGCRRCTTRPTSASTARHRRPRHRDRAVERRTRAQRPPAIHGAPPPARHHDRTVEHRTRHTSQPAPAPPASARFGRIHRRATLENKQTNKTKTSTSGQKTSGRLLIIAETAARPKPTGACRPHHHTGLPVGSPLQHEWPAIKEESGTEAPSP